MLSLHKELLEIERPYSQERILTTDGTKSFVDGDGVDGLIICFIGCLQLLSLIIDLIDDTMLATHEDSLQAFVFVLVGRSEAVLEIETGEYGVSCVVVQNDCRAPNISGIKSFPIPYSPQSNVFFSTGCHSH